MDASRALVQKLKRATTASEVAVLLNDTQDLLNPFVVSTAMSKLRRFGKPHEALAFFDRTIAHGVEQDVFTFNAAISASGTLRNWRKALGLFDDLKQRGLEPDIITYTAMISACEKGGQWKKAFDLFDECKQDRKRDV